MNKRKNRKCYFRNSCEIFFPYMIASREGQTAYNLFTQGQLLLTDTK